MDDKKVLVSISLGAETIRVGTLWFHQRDRQESASFEYANTWLHHPERFALEPALQLTEGAFHTGQGTRLFGALADSAPDRWGRVLMRRAEISQAQKEHRTPRTLFEMDYLLGVHDEARQGALRFSTVSDESVFLSSHPKTSIPPLVDLPTLLSATERFLADHESTADLKLLLAPGSSLGGARPKASVRDKDGSLAIAKFSKQDDEIPVVMWEATVLTLAKRAGIRVPSYRLETICQKPVLLIRRFDRDGAARIPFLSAMSMLGAHDNEEHSYLEMAYALLQHGASPIEDLHELWRRIVFTILVSNTDDHLRNHGFVYQRLQGWRLSPAYDINPTPTDMAPRMLTTAIDFENHAASLDTVMLVAKEFRLKSQEARFIADEVTHAVKQWRTVASALGLSKRDCDRMASAFEHE